MNSKVSIIVPVYKVEKYIGSCAVSLFSQTWSNIEFIFVDNNTPDCSMALVREVLKSFPSRRDSVVFIHESRQGLGYARYAGIKVATGDYILHVDSDDWVEPDFVEALVTKAEEEDADAVYCDFFKEYEGHPEKTRAVGQCELDEKTGKGAITAIHRGRMKAFNCNKLEKRSLYKLDSLVVPIRNMHEDIVYQTQILYGAMKVVHLARPLYHYRRMRNGAVTAGSKIKARKYSAEGLFHLYSSLPRTGSALEYIEHDLLTRAGWYSLCARDFVTLRSNPDALQYLADMKPKKGQRVSLLCQWLLKFSCQAISSSL